MMPPSPFAPSPTTYPLPPVPLSPPLLILSLRVTPTGQVCTDVQPHTASSDPSIPPAPVLHPFSSFFPHPLRPVPLSSSHPLSSPLIRRMWEEEEEKRAPDMDGEVLELIAEIDALPPLPTYSSPWSEREEKDPPRPRSRSSSCPEHFVTIALPPSTDTSVSPTPTSPSSAPRPPPIPRWSELELHLQRRLYQQLVAQMLLHPQEGEDWGMMEERRVTIQQRIDQHVRHSEPRPIRPLSPPSLHLEGPWDPMGSRCHGLSAPSTFVCPVCLEDCPSLQSVAMSQCGHVVCDGCLKSYLSSLIAEGQLLIRCPCFAAASSRPCPVVLSNNFISAFTPTAQYNHWLRLCLQKRHSTYRSCPRCDHQQKGSRLVSSITCDKCQFRYCFHHANAHPSTTSCRTYVKSQSASVKESLRMIGLTTVNCPSCDAPVEKESGCNHMTCTQCASEFCWLCGERYLGGIHFSELNILTGCPGMQHAGGMAGERRTVCRRLFRALVGWPLTVILIPLLFILAVALFVAVEALWLALFLLVLPAVLVMFCCCGDWVDRWQWRTAERVNFWLYLGPKLIIRMCSCCC